MKKYVLTCRCQSYIVPEINRTFYLGETWVLSEKEYQKSFVQRLIQLGAFSVEMQQECRMKKNPPKTKIPPFVRLRKGVTPTQPSSKPTDTSNEALKQIVQEEMASLKRDIVKEVTSELSTLLNQQQPSIDMSQLGQMISQSIQSSLSNVSVPQQAQHTQTKIDDEDEPIYIPSNITGSGIVSGNSLSVESISSDDSVNDAASALRAMKKKRKNN